MANYNLDALKEAIREAATRDFVAHISNGNSKTGPIPAFSMLPFITCSALARRTCALDGCYAIKNALRAGYNAEKNSVLKAWADNTAAALYHLDRLEEFLNRYFDGINAPRFFRIHVSGDFFSVAYAEAWRRVIINHPHTNFLFFTKQFDIMRKVDFLNVKNLSPVLSGWTGCEIPQDLIDAGYRVAWCNDGHETRIPADAIECPGHCDTCGACWSLYRIGKDTYFKKH